MKDYPKYTIEVEQGDLTINSVAPLCLSKNALLFEADTKQKYPELLGISSGSAIVSTGGASKEEKPTIIKIILDEFSKKTEFLANHWHTIVEIGRYSVFIGMFNMSASVDKNAPFWIRKDSIL